MIRKRFPSSSSRLARGAALAGTLVAASLTHPAAQQPSAASSTTTTTATTSGTSATPSASQSPQASTTSQAPPASQSSPSQPSPPSQGPATAQQLPPSSGDASGASARGARRQDDARTAQEEYRPPIVRFDAAGVSLADAVQLTLQHDPVLKIQRSTVRQQQGAAQEQRGAFDASLSGRLFYEYRQQELPQSRKDIEQEKRDDLTDEIAINRRDYNKAQTLVQQLQAVRDAGSGPGQIDAISSIDPDVGAQLRAIDLLISDQQTPAVRDELQRIRQDYIDRTVAKALEGAQGLVSGFEGAERDLFNLGATPKDEVFYNGGFDFQVGKRWRNGLFFAPFVNGQAEGSNYKDKARSSDFGGKGLQDLYTLKAGFSATVPLLRGRGRDATGAAERAARLTADASELALRHQAALSVLTTVRAYWTLRAAQQTVEVAERSVALQDRLFELSRASIQAGELAQVELARVQASQARSHARLRDAERNLVDARVALAIAMGVAADADDATLPRAADAFPTPPTSAAEQAALAPLAAPTQPAAATPGAPATPAAPAAAAAGATAPDAPAPFDAQPAPVADAAALGLDPATAAALLADAATRRNDALSTARLEESGRALRRGAQTEMRPKLDLQNTTWFTALDERTVSKALDRWVGPSADVSLEIEKPFGNNVRRGRFVQRDAEAQQRQIDLANLRRQIWLSVMQSTQSLGLARARVEQARTSVEAFRQTVDAEFERFRDGEATLIDAILTETQQVDARLGLITAEQDLATLIAQLRFDAGALVSFTGDQPVVNPADLIAAPGPPPAAAPVPPAPPAADAAGAPQAHAGARGGHAATPAVPAGASLAHVTSGAASAAADARGGAGARTVAAPSAPTPPAAASRGGLR